MTTPFIMNSMGLYFQKRPVFVLIVPSNAGPDDPAVIIGSELPLELSTYYGEGGSPITAIIYRASEGTYVYDILVTEGPDNNPRVVRATGYVDNFIVSEVYRVTEDGVLFGASLVPLAMYVHYRQEIIDGATLAIMVGAILDIFGVATVADGGSLNVASGGLFALDSGSSYTIDSISAPRGVRLYVASQSASGNIGTTATSVLASGAFTFLDGRAYRVITGSRVNLSATTNAATFQISRNNSNNAADRIVNLGPFGPAPAAGASTSSDASQIVKCTNGDFACTTVNVMLVASAGTTSWNAAADQPRFLMIEDIGEASAFTNARALT